MSRDEDLVSLAAVLRRVRTQPGERARGVLHVPRITGLRREPIADDCGCDAVRRKDLADKRVLIFDADGEAAAVDEHHHRHVFLALRNIEIEPMPVSVRAFACVVRQVRVRDNFTPGAPAPRRRLGLS